MYPFVQHAQVLKTDSEKGIINTFSDKNGKIIADQGWPGYFIYILYKEFMSD